MIDAEVSPDCDRDQFCKMLAQLVIDQGGKSSFKMVLSTLDFTPILVWIVTDVTLTALYTVNMQVYSRSPLALVFVLSIYE